MKATIYFFYEGGRHDAFSTDTETAEKDIRYWLSRQRSFPFVPKEILVIPESEHKSWLWVQDKLREEETAYATVIAERSEREEYERLKVKYAS